MIYTDTDKKKPVTYEPPKLEALGDFRDLTAGTGGSDLDGLSTNTRPSP